MSFLETGKNRFTWISAVVHTSVRPESGCVQCGSRLEALGYGLVTISLRTIGVPHITKLPAWVGFAKASGFAGCPEESATSTSIPASSGTDLASSGYAAVVIGAAHGSPAVAFTAPSLFCGAVQPAEFCV